MYASYDAKTPLAQVRDDAKRLTGPELAELVEFMNFNGTGQAHADAVRRLDGAKTAWRRYAEPIPSSLEREADEAVAAGLAIWERNAADGKTLGDYFSFSRILKIRNWINRRS